MLDGCVWGIGLTRWMVCGAIEVGRASSSSGLAISRLANFAQSGEPKAPQNQARAEWKWRIFIVISHGFHKLGDWDAILTFYSACL